MHHVAGSECVITLLGMKNLHPNSCSKQWTFNYGGYTIVMSLIGDLCVYTCIRYSDSHKPINILTIVTVHHVQTCS